VILGYSEAIDSCMPSYIGLGLCSTLKLAHNVGVSTDPYVLVIFLGIDKATSG
jgi:hypothetical protein